VIVDPQYENRGPQNYVDYVLPDGLRNERIALAVELLEFNDTDIEVTKLILSL
jgi:hypothetical protein